MFRELFVTCVLLLIKTVSGADRNEYYDLFKGIPLSQEQLEIYDKANITESCAIRIQDCNADEGRRIDGTCNNLHNVSRGARNTPLLRLLPPLFHNVSEPRLSQNGEPLPLCRRLRTDLLLVGHVYSQVFTQLVPYLFAFVTADITSFNIVDDISTETDCCKLKATTNENNGECISMRIPADDPVHRFSNFRCMNQTRPKSFQSLGCLRKGTEPETVMFATSHFDLSVVYGSDSKSLIEKGRKFKDGLLKYEKNNGKIWPPSQQDPFSQCILNKQPSETRCHDTPDKISNTALGLNLMTVWFWRNHNKIAEELGKMNHCWNDEMIFETARDINIATANQIFYYELLPNLMGKENLIKDEVISFGRGHRDVYNEEMVPQTSLEFSYIMRWLHVLKSGTLKMYDARGRYLKEVPSASLNLRTGYVTNNIESISRGSFTQSCSRRGRIVHPNMAELGLGPLQKMYDVFAADICKGRYYGLGSYVQYREFCTGENRTRFEDLKDVIDDENIKLLKRSYKNVKDIDLMAGVWLERAMENGHVPPTFYCLVVDQFRRNTRSDRHWYERPNRPNPFNIRQLHEIRKATIANLLCDVGDSVTDVQPDAFNTPGFGNRPKTCKSNDGINLRAWHDLNCSARNVNSTNSI